MKLSQAAEREVADLMRQLPADIRGRVREIPIVLDTVPSQALVNDGVESDLLGLFIGDPYDEEGQHTDPRQIILFLENLWDDAGFDMQEFCEQVRDTVLHEVGHYLGLEEDDLFERGIG